MLATVKAGSEEERALFDAMAGRAGRQAGEVRAAVREMLCQLRARGWEAARDISLARDGAPPREIFPDELRAAYRSVDSALRDALEEAARRILDYQKRLVPQGSVWTGPGGGRVGQLVRPLARAGVYVPGGTAAYPSSVLMNALPARAAGVGEIVMLTPPLEFLRPEVLAAAHIAGVHRVFALGGVPAVAAMAWGLGPVPRCDKAVGPGNAYVTEAKRQLFGDIDIDLMAGPSEILVLAGAGARPDWVAADLLGQAEHGELSGAILVCFDETLAAAVSGELEHQIASLPRRDIAAAALRNFGAAVVCASREEAAALVDRVAPEHLEICDDDPESWLGLLRNFGAAFLGHYTPEALGDYLAGPSHVLPTSGTARFFSPLSAESFVKKSSVIAFDRESFSAAAPAVALMARCEFLDAHARSAEIRKAGPEAR